MKPPDWARWLLIPFAAFLGYAVVLVVDGLLGFLFGDTIMARHLSSVTCAGASVFCGSICAPKYRNFVASSLFVAWVVFVTVLCTIFVFKMEHSHWLQFSITMGEPLVGAVIGSAIIHQQTADSNITHRERQQLHNDIVANYSGNDPEHISRN